MYIKTHQGKQSQIQPPFRSTSLLLIISYTYLAIVWQSRQTTSSQISDRLPQKQPQESSTAKELGQQPNTNASNAPLPELSTQKSIHRHIKAMGDSEAQMPPFMHLGHLRRCCMYDDDLSRLHAVRSARPQYVACDSAVHAEAPDRDAYVRTATCYSGRIYAALANMHPPQDGLRALLDQASGSRRLAIFSSSRCPCPRASHGCPVMSIYSRTQLHFAVRIWVHQSCSQHLKSHPHPHNLLHHPLGQHAEPSPCSVELTSTPKTSKVRFAHLCALCSARRLGIDEM